MPTSQQHSNKIQHFIDLLLEFDLALHSYSTRLLRMGFDQIFEVHSHAHTGSLTHKSHSAVETYLRLVVGGLRNKGSTIWQMWRRAQLLSGLCVYFDLICNALLKMHFFSAWHAIFQMSNRLGPIWAPWLPPQLPWLTVDREFQMLFLPAHKT